MYVCVCVRNAEIICLLAIVSFCLLFFHFATFFGVRYFVVAVWLCPRRFSFLFPFLECCDSYNTVWKRERMWQHFIAALLFCIARTTHYAYTYKRAGTHTIIRRHTYTQTHTHIQLSHSYFICRAVI